MVLGTSRVRAQTGGTTPDGYQYSTTAGQVTITGYSGSGGALTLPSSIAGNPVTTIGDNAFQLNKYITSVTLPTSITSVGNEAFFGCPLLATFSYPASVSSIGSYALADCESMTAILVDPANPTYSSDGIALFDHAVTQIVEYPCGRPGSYSLPASVTTIAAGAFVDAVHLTGIGLPAGLTTIGAYAFAQCPALTSLAIPASVTSIGFSITYISSVASVSVDPGNPNFSTDGVALFNKTKTALVAYLAGNTGDYTVPAGVTTIDDDAFNSCSLYQITFPDTVTSIGASAFNGCSALSSITIPANVTSIGFLAIANCSSLTSITVAAGNGYFSSDGAALFNKTGTELIAYAGARPGFYTIPSGVNTIDPYAFSDAYNLTSVTVPASVTSIGRYAFSSTNLLTSIAFMGDAPMTDPTAFASINSSAAITYEYGTTGWTNPFAGLPAIELNAPTPTPGISEVRLINISTRAQVGTGANILIQGFVVAGGGQETLLIRADGPSLAQFGISGVLAQPSLTVLNSTGALVASNTGWENNVDPMQIASVATQVGAFGFAVGSADSAVLVKLGAGAYTVQIAGVGNSAGIALAEIYEVASTGTRLINLSTRGEVGSGAGIIISGFVIGGAGAEELLVRGTGPSLARFNVADFLAQPRLEILNGQTVVASNVGWGTSPDSALIASLATSLGAFPLTPESADSAAVVHLSAGAYTAQVSGVGNTEGVALTEIYEEQ